MNLSMRGSTGLSVGCSRKVYRSKRLKIGDVDARIEEKLCYTISDKARKIGNGVAEAIDLVYKTK